MNVLFAPHNDDETLFSCFNALRYNCHVVVCLRSVRMHALGYPGGPVTADREAETACAMRVLGLEWTQWPVPDDDPNWKEVADLMAILAATGDVERVFAPAPEKQGHEQHNVIGHYADAFFGPDRVTHYLTYTTAGRSTHGSRVEPPDGAVDLKREALMCYQSQIEHPATSVWFQGDLTEYVA
jgi:LmbE family N-acetylglucosaminyl deacetylase